jgi:hypothetical protein
MKSLWKNKTRPNGNANTNSSMKPATCFKAGVEIRVNFVVLTPRYQKAQLVIKLYGAK